MVFRGNASIQQACCNHWECPICGQTRARQEYRKIVFGAECLADEGHELYFWTLTCRGREMSLEAAEKDYLAWTNVLLTNARIKCKRDGGFWCYVQITERQKRQHPHSHIITTFVPGDAAIAAEQKGRVSLSSIWFARANKSAGLGAQHRISKVDNPSAVSRYVAKYMFKDSMLTKWPNHWRRVRYSQNWPTPPYHPAEWVTQLLKPADWHQVSERAETFVCETDGIFEVAYHRLGNIRKREGDLTF